MVAFWPSIVMKKGHGTRDTSSPQPAVIVGQVMKQPRPPPSFCIFPFKLKREQLVFNSFPVQWLFCAVGYIKHASSSFSPDKPRVLQANGSTVQTQVWRVLFTVGGGGGGLVVLLRPITTQRWWSGVRAPVGSQQQPGPHVGEGLSRPLLSC